MGVLEQDFMKAIMLALGSRQGIRLHRQNTGGVEIIKRGKYAGYFEAGPPAGAADLSGIVGGTDWGGWRIEIEIKGTKTKDREAQENWQHMIELHSGIYLRIRYNEHLSMQENVEIGVSAVEKAIQQKKNRK